jgi:hypothetical protein
VEEISELSKTFTSNSMLPNLAMMLVIPQAASMASFCDSLLR